jgi:hypothetical protein
MFTQTYDDITDLSYGLTKTLVYSRPEGIDYQNSMDFQIHNIVVEARSCEYEFDLKDIWVTKSRWNSLARQYIDPDALNIWLDVIEKKLKGKKRGLSFKRTNQVAKRTAATSNKEWRVWGSCMLGFGYRALPRPQITLHSRTTYLGYIGQLDLALVHVLAREIGKRVGLEPKDISFVWHLEAAQFHSFKSLAWFFQHDRDRDRLENRAHTEELRLRAPVLWLSQKRFQEYLDMDEQGLLYCDMSFSQQLRIRRRYHTEVHGPKYGKPFEGGTRLKSASMARVAQPLPSIPVERLDFSCLTKPLSEQSDLIGYIGEDDE